MCGQATETGLGGASNHNQRLERAQLTFCKCLIISKLKLLRIFLSVFVAFEVSLYIHECLLRNIREKSLAPRRAPRRSLLPISPKRTQIRLKSLLYL